MKKKNLKILSPRVIKEPITDLKKREGLLILLEAANFNVYEATRRHEEQEKFPYLAFNGEKITSTAQHVNIWYDREVISYNVILKQVQILIKKHKNHESGN